MSKSENQKKIGELKEMIEDIKLIGIYNPLEYRLLNLKEAGLAENIKHDIKWAAINAINNKIKKLETEQ